LSHVVLHSSTVQFLLSLLLSNDSACFVFILCVSVFRILLPNLANKDTHNNDGEPQPDNKTYN